MAPIIEKRLVTIARLTCNANAIDVALIIEDGILIYLEIVLLEVNSSLIINLTATCLVV